MTLLLGVDGGGTKTAARIVSVGQEGRLCVLASGFAGGSNPYSVGWSAAQQAIAEAIAGATASLEEMPEIAVMAVAGCASEETRDRLTGWATGQAFANRVEVVPDTEPILADLPASSDAIGVIAGTGSSIVARHGTGGSDIVGGWGYLIDDGGSGYALGRDALRHLATQQDAQEPLDGLSQAVMRQLGVNCADGLKPWVYRSNDPRGRVASLAPLVLQRAKLGDRAALAIVDAGVDALAASIGFAAKRLAGKASNQAVRLAGGLLAHSPLYRGRLTERLIDAGWHADQIGAAPDGAIGCALLAARLLG